MITIRELRRALFEVQEQDRPADLGGVLALATGDLTLGERLATLLEDLASDARVAPELAGEADALCEALGFRVALDEPMIYTHDGLEFARTGKKGTVSATGESSEEYRSVTDPGRRIWITASGTVLED